MTMRRLAPSLVCAGLVIAVVSTSHCKKEETTTTETTTTSDESPPVVEETGTLTEASTTPSNPTWNVWVGSDELPVVTGNLQPNRDYDVHFDLSALDYSKIVGDAAASGPTDQELADQIHNLKREAINIVAQTLILGDGLKLRGNFSPTVSVRINLARIRQPVAIPPGGAKALPALSAAANVLEPTIVVPVRTTGSGCAAVAITVFDSDLNAPLDNVLRRLTVGNAAGCLTKPVAAQTLETGRLALLASPYSRRADAALYVFDTELGPGRQETPAVFLLGGKNPKVNSWKLERSLTSYLGGAGGGEFRSDLVAARSCFDTRPDRQCYATVAEHLRSVVFPNIDATAESSYQLLKTLAERPSKPSIFFRLVDLGGRTTLLPLGLLGLGPGERLASKMDAILPMPHERAPDPGRCIASWTVVVPEVLDEADGFLEPVTPSPSGWIRSWKDFAGYAKGTGNPTQPGAEGFLLLSHHGGGKLTFTPKSDPIQSLVPEQFTHRFPKGSVAILAACSVGALGEDNEGLPLLEKLNNLGIDTAILSPFDVRAPIGARFAIQFAEQVRKASLDTKPVELLELLRKSREAVRQDRLSKAFADELDEFVLMGSSRIPVCAPS